jgi:tetratricopeptide (TPR) repeat protein
MSLESGQFEQDTDEGNRLIGLPMAYHALGRKADSDAALAALIAKYEKDCSYNIAHVYAFRGEADQALAWLDKAVEYQVGGVSDCLKVVAPESLRVGRRVVCSDW